MTYDILIKNGKIIDGTGSPWFTKDIGIIDQRIVDIGRLEHSSTDKIIDAKGLIVSPGFIDIHSHSDMNFLINRKADSKIRQGVTTEIVGNCGISVAPIRDIGKKFLFKRYENFNIDWDWNSVSEYLNKLEKIGIPLNLGMLIGYDPIRTSVMGYESREPNDNELNEMKKLLTEGMEDGAFGFSIMLKEAPGVYSSHREILEFCRIVKRFGGIYVPHQRTQGDELIESLDESIRIAEETSISLHISHLKVKGRRNWGKSFYVVKLIDEAREKNLDISFDQYPYAASGGWVGMPAWSLEGGIEKLIERLSDKDLRKEIEKGITQHEDWGVGPDNLKISIYPPNRNYEGKSLEELSILLEKNPETIWCDLIQEYGRIPGIIKHSMWDNDVKRLMIHPSMMVGSDGSSITPEGILGRGKPHPRNYGTFPRFIGRYVIKDGLINLEEGIRRITHLSATRLGIYNRGLISINRYADITIFDPKKIIDLANFEQPHQYSNGIEYVIVNGLIVVEKQNLTEEMGGKALKKTR